MKLSSLILHVGGRRRLPVLVTVETFKFLLQTSCFFFLPSAKKREAGSSSRSGLRGVCFEANPTITSA